MQFPAIIGGVVPVVNIEGVAAGRSEVHGPGARRHLSLGKIKTWNDKAIADVNPGVEAAGDADHRRAPLRTARAPRSSVTNYLSKVSPEWKDEGRRRHRGRVARPASAARATKASPPTCSGSRARSATSNTRTRKQNKMTYAQRAEQGRPVRPARRHRVPGRRGGARTGRARPGFYQILTDQPGKNSWPITGAELHPDARRGRTSRRTRPRCSSSSTGRSRTARRWPTSSTTSALPDAVTKVIADAWKSADQGRVRQGGVELGAPIVVDPSRLLPIPVCRPCRPRLHRGRSL